eukprot:scaffold52606_cov21-Tisochrysis_lutea.AAC.6
MANDKLKPLQRTDTSAEQFTDTYKLTGETGSYRYMAPEVFRHEPYNLKVWECRLRAIPERRRNCI